MRCLLHHNIDLHTCFYPFVFSLYYPHVVRKSLFLGHNFEIKSLINLHDLKSFESQNHILGLSLCMHVCVYFICIIQKQIITTTLNLAFCICIIGRCYLKFFTEIGQIICVQGHKINLIHYPYGRNFLLMNFNVFILHSA